MYLKFARSDIFLAYIICDNYIAGAGPVMQERRGRELSLPQQVCSILPGVNQDFFSPSIRLTINSPLVRYFCDCVLLIFLQIFSVSSELIDFLSALSLYLKASELKASAPPLVFLFTES